VAMLANCSLLVARVFPAERSHNAAIDGLRALAVLAVVLFHTNATWLPGGFTGVDLFFVVSGFVISQSLASRTHASLGAMLLDFYRRRVLRLLPALLVMLMATFVLSALFIPRAWRNEQFDQTGWAALIGLSNVVLAGQQDDYFSPGAELNPFLHTWTLGVEEQFYLVFPLLFFVWLRGRERWPWSRWLLPVLTVLSLAWAGWQAQSAPVAAFYLLPARFWELAAGALLYQWTRTRTPGRNGDAVAAAGLALLAAGVVIAPQLAMPVPGVLATVAGTLLLLASVSTAGTSRIAGALGCAPLAYLGRLSYSLYLWHWPLLVLLRWTYGLHGVVLWLYPVLLLAVSAGSYHFIERPLRSAAPLLRLVPAKVLAMAFPLVALCGAGAWATVEYHEQVSLSVTRDGYAWQARRYPAWRPLEPVRAPWAQLAEALPDLVEARTVALDVAGAERALAHYADAVAAVEVALFADKPRTGAGRAVQLQTLAQRLQDAGVAGVPRSLLDEDSSTAAQRWAQHLLKGWGTRVPGPRPRRVWSSLARARLAAQAAGKPIEATPVRTLLRVWWAARG